MNIIEMITASMIKSIEEQEKTMCLELIEKGFRFAAVRTIYKNPQDITSTVMTRQYRGFNDEEEIATYVMIGCEIYDLEKAKEILNQEGVQS